MKSVIKAFLSAALILTAATSLPSCNKGEEQQSYPSHLSGTWKNMNASSGYTTTLKIEDIDGGQYGYFTRMSPVKEITLSTEGSFTYDSATGKGLVKSNLAGGPTVSVNAALSTDSYLDVTAKLIVSARIDTLFQGTLKKVDE